MALVFFNDPVAPVRCAIAISRTLGPHPSLQLRMGLHSGPVYKVEDINANANVSGGGINIAQRVMDCGDAGHILLSRAIREFVNQVGSWPLHDLGECEVKHGERLHLYNLYTQEVGNPAAPRILHAASAVRTPPAPETSSTSETGLRVALLYKRHAEPDGHLLQLLEQQLTAAGHSVFIDRHMSIGVEWAKEIEAQVKGADAIIPLLSPASIQSEMLEWEVQRAHEAAQEQNGKPRILPVRVNFTGPLTEVLAGILDPLEYALWEGPEGDDALVEELKKALTTPQSSRAVPLDKLEPVGGAVPLDSRFYVVRPADEEFSAAIVRGDSIVLVKGARQMGKTSLLARGLQQARQAGSRVVRTDFQKLNARHLESADTLLLTLANSICDQLDLEVEPEEAWHPRRGPSENFERYWRRHALRSTTQHIVWGLDEVDRLFTCDFASEIFGLFRSWHNERALDPDGPWRRLTLAIAYATEAHLFITDINQSPFNVGTRLTLQDFTLDQIADLNERHGSPLQSTDEIARFARLLSGHPYLVRRGLHEMAARGLGIQALQTQADRDEGVYGDHLRRILVLLAQDEKLCEIVRGILRGEACPDETSFYRLRSAGVMTGTSARDVRPRCALYQTYLSRHLL